MRYADKCERCGTYKMSDEACHVCYPESDSGGGFALLLLVALILGIALGIAVGKTL